MNIQKSGTSDFHFEIAEAPEAAVVTQVTEEQGVFLVEIQVAYAVPCVPQPVTLTWKEPMEDIGATWSPLCDRNHKVMQWINPTQVYANLYFGTPVFATVRYDGTNHTVVALSDTVKPSRISFCVEDFEQKEEVSYAVTVLAEEHDVLQAYSVKLRIDRRRLDFCQAVMETSQWMR